MAPAPTIRLAATGAPTGPPKPPGIPVGSPTPTTPLKPLGSPTPTTPIKPPGVGAPPTIALPKATVQLQAPTKPLGTSFASPSQMATVQVDEDDAVANEGLLNILSGVGLAAALVVLAFQLMTANTWINSEDNTKKGDWALLLE